MTAPAWICIAFTTVNILVGNILYFRFLKTRKFSSMLFFATVPFSIMFAGAVYLVLNLTSFSGETISIIKVAMQISTTNYNKYYWTGVIVIFYVLSMFLMLYFMTKPLYKVERETKRLSFGEVNKKIVVGGSKQFMEIENSLNKINDIYKKKDDFIKQTNLEYEKFVPKQILKFLGKKNVLELEVDSQVKKVATTLFCNLRNSADITETLSLEENFSFISSYLNVVSPIIKKFGGFVDKYLDDGLLAVFVSPEIAVNCGKAIIKTITERNLKETKSINIDVGIGIHTGEVVFGVVGDENQKSPTPISNSVNIASKMDEINKMYGSSIIFSKETLNSLGADFKLLYRYIGNLKLVDQNRIISVFELLDCYARQKREKLVKNTSGFEEAVRYYINGKFAFAKEKFEEVYKKEKDDKVCYVYFNKCIENLKGKTLKSWM